MVPRLLERESALAELCSAVDTAMSGRGSVTLVHGEAGIGKSSLVAALGERLAGDVRMLVGYCDDLLTPRPLGPMRDLIPDVGPELARALRAGSDREEILAALRDELCSDPRGSLLVVEDTHWADDATLDVLRLLIRRISDLPAALVLTCRDDEIGHEHRLQPLIGQLPHARQLRRIPLRPLSRDAVRELSAACPVDADRLHAVTSGNPFFVTEVLAFDGEVPPTVIDAVVARLRCLAPDVRGWVEQLAVAGSVVERWLAEALISSPASNRLASDPVSDRMVPDLLAPDVLASDVLASDRRALDGPVSHGLVLDGIARLSPAERQGLITVSPTRVTYRHELTRRAIVDSLPGARRVELHGRVLARLAAAPDVDPARLANHATEAGDVDAIVRYATMAARCAARAGAHREAVAHYRSVLEHRDRFEPGDRAELLRGYAAECYTVGDASGAVTAQMDVVDLSRAAGQRRRLGADLWWLSRLHWWNGDRPAAEQAAREAIEVLVDAGDDRLLAQAYSNQSQLDMVADRYRESVGFGERAVALAREVADPVILAHALNNLGTVRWVLGSAAVGRPVLEESLRVALEAGEVDHACRAYANLAGRLIEDLRLSEARRYLAEALELAERSEHLGFVGYLHLVRGLAAFSAGEWGEVDRAAERAAEFRLPVVRAGFELITGRVRIRRGQPGGDRLLESAARCAPTADQLQQMGLVAAGLAEHAWLSGDREGVRRYAEPTYTWARRIGHRRWVYELGYRLAMVGHDIEPFDDGDHPYALQVAGRCAQAASAWQAAGFPYEQAAALAESNRHDDLLAALEILDRLDAGPLARIVRGRLRDLGMPRVPRGPITTTRDNPAGLTPRQLEVAWLLAEEKTNAQIAQALVLSVRTVDNHVAAILDKLRVRSRRQAQDRIRAFDGSPALRPGAVTPDHHGL